MIVTDCSSNCAAEVSGRGNGTVLTCSIIVKLIGLDAGSFNVLTSRLISILYEFTRTEKVLAAVYLTYIFGEYC